MLQGVTPKVPLDEIPCAVVHRLPGERELVEVTGGRYKPILASEQAEHGGGRRHVGNREGVQGLQKAQGVELAGVGAGGDTEREGGDGSVPEAVTPGRRRRTEVAVTPLEPKPVERGDHQGDDRPVGVTYGLRQRTRRPRRVLEDGEVVGGRVWRVVRAFALEAPAELRVDGDHTDRGEEGLPTLRIPFHEQHLGPAIVDAQRHAFGAEQGEEGDGDGAALQCTEERRVEERGRLEHDAHPIALRDALVRPGSWRSGMTGLTTRRR